MVDDRDRETERTTIVTTDGDGRSSAWIILLVAIIVVLLAVLFFGGVFNRGEDDQLNVDLNTPDVNVMMPPPETQTPVIVVPGTQVPAAPDVNVNVTTPPPEPPADNLTNTESAVTNSG